MSALYGGISFETIRRMKLEEYLARLDFLGERFGGGN